jgi:flagellar basal-body rod protein FlgB
MNQAGDKLTLLHGVLDAMAARARAAMHNIANQNTPGYKRYVVHFEDEMRQAAAAGRPAGDVAPVVVRDESGPEGVNNVTLFDEVATLDKVKLVYDLFTQRTGAHFLRLKRAITGRG